MHLRFRFLFRDNPLSNCSIYGAINAVHVLRCLVDSSSLSIHWIRMIHSRIFFITRVARPQWIIKRTNVYIHAKNSQVIKANYVLSTFCRFYRLIGIVARENVFERHLIIGSFHLFSTNCFITFTWTRSVHCLVSSRWCFVQAETDETYIRLHQHIKCHELAIISIYKYAITHTHIAARACDNVRAGTTFYSWKSETKDELVEWRLLCRATSIRFTSFNRSARYISTALTFSFSNWIENFYLILFLHIIEFEVSGNKI